MRSSREAAPRPTATAAIVAASDARRAVVPVWNAELLTIAAARGWCSIDQAVRSWFSRLSDWAVCDVELTCKVRKPSRV